MKIYKDIQQGTEEWHELRWGKVGGSTLKKVMANDGKPVRDNAVFAELFGEMCEDYDPFNDGYVSKAMQAGIEKEPLAAAEFERITGLKCFEIGWAEKDDEFTGISPDRIVGSLDKITQAFETKAPEAQTFAGYLLDNSAILTDYAWQIVQYFNVFEDLETLYFFVYRPENRYQKHILLSITRDTYIEVNKKKVAPVRQLVAEAQVRLKELKEVLDDEINELTKPKF